jgi:hypothetical protein
MRRYMAMIWGDFRGLRCVSPGEPPERRQRIWVRHRMTRKPPMFGSPMHGLPLPLQYLARARQFRDALGGGHAYVNAEMNWPKYALLLQAIELALKAYCYQCFDGKPKPKGLHNHDLNGWYEAACSYGLRPVPELADALDILGPVHLDSSARYPTNRPVYELEGVAQQAAHAAIAAVEPLIRKC